VIVLPPSFCRNVETELAVSLEIVEGTVVTCDLAVVVPPPRVNIEVASRLFVMIVEPAADPAGVEATTEFLVPSAAAPLELERVPELVGFDER
jgi:hypothetical protein